MFNFYLYRVAQWIALHVPLSFGYWLAAVISDIRLTCNSADRRATIENLAVIFPEKSLKEREKICRDLFRNFAKYLVDFFRFSKLNKDLIAKTIKVENLHYFTDSLKNGKGVIVLTAHIGNWELGGAVAASMLDKALWAVALPHKHKKVNDFFNNQRSLKNIHVIALSKAARQCLIKLRENQLVALVGDRNFNLGGKTMKFFGKDTVFPEGPAAFSLRTGAPIVCGFMLRQPDDTFVLTMEKPIIYSPTGDEEKDTAALMNQYIAIYERYIRTYPDQWYMFKRFWKTP